MLFYVLTAEWLHLVQYFSTEYPNPRQNIIILFLKYLVDISSEAWLNLIWENIKGKLFSVGGKQAQKMTIVIFYCRIKQNNVNFSFPCREFFEMKEEDGEVGCEILELLISEAEVG